jgi:IMP cyclohydrolase
MEDLKQYLKNRPYVGRFIILGKSPDKCNVAVYGITGRSPSSQARRLVLKDLEIKVEPTDPKVLAQGNIDLLVYPAVILRYGIAVSNGKQTSDVARFLDGRNPSEALSMASANWDYEPDSPNFTPRISGGTFKELAALGIIKRGEDGKSVRDYFEVPMSPGQGSFISTYTGENKDPLPPFAGNPVQISLVGNNASEIAEQVYEAFAPQEGAKDFRVSVASVYEDTRGMALSLTAHIVNRCERGQ